MKPFPKKTPKSISNVRNSGVHFRGYGVFILAGVRCSNKQGYLLTPIY